MNDNTSVNLQMNGVGGRSTTSKFQYTTQCPISDEHTLRTEGAASELKSIFLLLVLVMDTQFACFLRLVFLRGLDNMLAIIHEHCYHLAVKHFLCVCV